MLVTINNILELSPIIKALRSLPVEGENLNEVIRREYAREISIRRVEEHSKANIFPTTILIDDYWGYRVIGDTPSCVATRVIGDTTKGYPTWNL